MSERKPPARWRRNMVASALFLAILDGVILSASPDITRAIIAIAVTLTVGIVIASIWRRNSALEKGPVSAGKRKADLKSQ